MEEIKIGMPEGMEMPPEPPQKRAEEIGLAQKPHRQERKKGFELPQPPRNKEVKEEEVKKVTPEEAKAEAVRPNLDRAKVTERGKIRPRTAKGQARPI